MSGQPLAVPELVVTSSAVVGLAVGAITLASLLVGLLWKAFSTHSLLLRMQAELHPNHGSSLRDQVDATRQLGEATAQTVARFTASNESEHKDLHRRVDGLFVMLGRPDQSTRVAQRHHTHRGDAPE